MNINFKDFGSISVTDKENMNSKTEFTKKTRGQFYEH